MENLSDKYQFKLEAQPIGFFETPIAYGRLKEGENLLKDLESVIRQNQKQSAGVTRSNIGSWHSDTDMMQWGGDAAKKLADTAVSIAKRMSHFNESQVERFDWTVSMWANITPKEGLNHMHAHPGNLWAAVLYLDMGNEPDSEQEAGGAFYIEDPRFPMAAMHNTGFRMKDSNGNTQQYQVELNLERGNLIVFPAWLRHGVRPYHGNRERISIALNIDALPKY